MPSLLPRRLDRRTVPVLLVAGALVVSAGVGGATAGALITGRDIADRSITSADIANRTIGTSQIRKEAIARLRTRWNAGSGAPRDQGASTGTWYLDKATGDAYKKTVRGWEFRVNIMGATGAPGAVGPQGANGGAGATGAKGDAGAKGDPGGTGAKGDAGEAGAKGETGNAGATGAKGDAGEAGSAWLHGAGVPSAAIGAVGDWYLDSTSYDAYQKDADGWVAVVNLRGPVGPKGDVGATGAKGDIGEQGSTGPTGAIGPAGSTGSTGAIGPAGPIGLTGPEGAQGQVGPSGPIGADGADAVSAYAQFFALAPPDNAVTVAAGTNVSFPQDGPSSGTITRIGPGMINLPDVGTYRVSFSVPVTENGQLVVALNGSDLPYTVVGRATGTSTIAGESLVQTTFPNSLLAVGNPAGNPSALTITPLAGGTRPVAATLIIEQLG